MLWGVIGKFGYPYNRLRYNPGYACLEDVRLLRHEQFASQWVRNEN